HQVTADRSMANVPAALHNVVLFEPHGALVNANRGLIEYADLLKRPLEAFKYLLGFSETSEVPLEHMILQLDEVLIASSNEMHLYEEGVAPDRVALAQSKELRKQREAVYAESDAYPNYEGRSGASAREIKTALFNAAQNPSYRCLNALAVLEELEALCKDKSV